MIVGPRLTASISSRRTFQALSATGRRGGSGPLRVRYLADAHGEQPRVAYAISRRVGSAVARNRLRRRLRAAVDEIAAELRPGAYLISPEPAASGMGFTELIASLRESVAAVGAARKGDE